MNRHLYTVGHSYHSPERFVELLTSNGVQTLVDVRSQPYFLDLLTGWGLDHG